MDASLAQGTVRPAIGLAVAGLPLALWWYFDYAYGKWSKVPMSLGMTGADAARRMLDGSGIASVGVAQVEGRRKDCYIPRDNRICLSTENYGRGSVASVAVACHEAGHAVQDATGYAPMRLRAALVPAASLTSQTWWLVFMAGVMLNWAGLAQLAVALFGVSVLFHVVTLPVEIDASMRAVRYIDGITDDPRDRQGARNVLTAAALTYVASAMSSVLQLLYYMGRVSRRR